MHSICQLRFHSGDWTNLVFWRFQIVRRMLEKGQVLDARWREHDLTIAQSAISLFGGQTGTATPRSHERPEPFLAQRPADLSVERSGFVSISKCRLGEDLTNSIATTSPLCGPSVGSSETKMTPTHLSGLAMRNMIRMFCSHPGVLPNISPGFYRGCNRLPTFSFATP